MLLLDTSRKQIRLCDQVMKLVLRGFFTFCLCLILNLDQRRRTLAHEPAQVARKRIQGGLELVFHFGAAGLCRLLHRSLLFKLHCHLQALEAEAVVATAAPPRFYGAALIEAC